MEPLTDTDMKEIDQQEKDIKFLRESWERAEKQIDALYKNLRGMELRAEQSESHACHLLARAEKAEARVRELEAHVSVMGGAWCAENRTEGRDRCGACAWCVAFEKARAEKAEARVRELERLLAIATQSQDFCFVCGRSDCQHRPDVPDSVRAVKAEKWSAAWKSLAAEMRRAESSHDRHFRHYVRASNQIGDVE